MPNEYNKTLKYNHGEKILKALLMIYADVGYLLKKCIHVKIILKNFIQKKKRSIHLLAIHFYKLFI